MSLQIDPARFLKQPLLLHQREPGEYWVIIAGFVAGRVSRYQAADGDLRWIWQMTGPCDHREGVSDSGDGRSLLDAKEALRLALQSCIDKATLSNATMSWAS